MQYFLTVIKAQNSPYTGPHDASQVHTVNLSQLESKMCRPIQVLEVRTNNNNLSAFSNDFTKLLVCIFLILNLILLPQKGSHTILSNLLHYILKLLTVH